MRTLVIHKLGYSSARPFCQFRGPKNDPLCQFLYPEMFRMCQFLFKLFKTVHWTVLDKQIWINIGIINIWEYQEYLNTFWYLNRLNYLVNPKKSLYLYIAEYFDLKSRKQNICLYFSSHFKIMNAYEFSWKIKKII